MLLASATICDYEARRVGKQLNGFGKIPPGRFVEVEHDGNKIELSKAFTKCVQHGFSLSS